MTTSIPSSISFKIRDNDCYYRFNLPSTEELFDKLLEALQEREIKFVKLFWIDEEGDRVSLKNALDLKDAMQVEGRLIRLEIMKDVESEVLVQEDVSTKTLSTNNGIVTTNEANLLEGNRRHRHRCHRRAETTERSRSPRIPMAPYLYYSTTHPNQRMSSTSATSCLYCRY